MEVLSLNRLTEKMIKQPKADYPFNSLPDRGDLEGQQYISKRGRLEHRWEV